MEQRTPLRKDELAGLAAAALLHVGLAAVLLLQPDPEKEEIIKPQERIAVSLATEVGLTATSPDPAEISRAAEAPVISPDNTPGMAVPDIPVLDPDPSPPEPDVTPNRTSNSPPKDTSQRRRPDNTASKAPPKKSPPKKSPPKKSPPKKSPPKKGPPKKDPPKKTPPKGSGGSKVGDDFLAGAGKSNNPKDSRLPAGQIGASAQASLKSAINRQIKPHWTAPQGVDADKLVTILSFQLNPNGTLKGRPRVVSQSGDNASNRAQKQLHAERAIRAVQLAAPFDLPDRYYNSWKNIKSWRFDRRL